VSGESVIFQRTISIIKDSLYSLEEYLGKDPYYINVKEHLQDLVGRYGDFTINNDDPFNTAMCRFYEVHMMELPEPGRIIYEGVKTLLGLTET
jgi:hypothetical protein